MRPRNVLSSLSCGWRHCLRDMCPSHSDKVWCSVPTCLSPTVQHGLLHPEGTCAGVGQGLEDEQGEILLSAGQMHIQEDKNQFLTFRGLLAKC